MLFLTALLGVVMSRLLKPLFKYPGGKGSEFKYLKKLFPKFNTYVEPFVGGGAVYWGVNARQWIINDYAQELISIYEYGQMQDPIFLSLLYDIGIIWEKKNQYIEEILDYLVSDRLLNALSFEGIAYDLLNLTDNINKDYQLMMTSLFESLLRKKKSLGKISKQAVIKNWDENALGVLGAAVYTYFRASYNSCSFENEPQLKTTLYFFLREYAYSSMFRYNADGMFNVPFGGNTYAKKSFLQKFDLMSNLEVVSKLRQTRILRGDFSQALIDTDDAFIFLDPPYDSEFSTYNLHVFDSHEQIRLRNELLNIHNAKWLMVVKSTDFIENLYEQEGWYKFRFDKSYSVNFKNRNDKDVQHLVITNYRLENL